MGLFSNSTPFDADVEKATDEKSIGEDWAKIMDICDRVGNCNQNAKDCLTSIMSRLKHQDPHVALKSITLLDACVNNCGKAFHLLIASREFENEFRKILAKAHEEVKTKMLASLRSWAESEFKNDPQLNLIPSLMNKLRQEGYVFSANEQKPVKSTSKEAEIRRKEDDELAKAIELSLKESSSPKSKVTSSSPSSSNLYPSTSLMTAQAATEGRKVRALYDFEAAEDNELTFQAGEIIIVTDDSDPNWWKGNNKRGEGLFPSNFVTADLTYEIDQPKVELRKSVQFDDEVIVKKITKEPVEVEIDESKMDKLLHYLHEADPTNSSGDPPEMLELAEDVNAMGPLIDAELERVDRKHAQLTQLSLDLVDALNLYHSLMREPTQATAAPPAPSAAYAPLKSIPPPSATLPPSAVGMPYGPYGPPQPTGIPQMNGAPAPPPHAMPPYGVPMMGPQAPMAMPRPMGMPPMGPPPMGQPGMMPPPAGAMPPPSYVGHIINGHYPFPIPHTGMTNYEVPGSSRPVPNTSNYQEKPPMQ